ncbi:hypothetical protein ACF0H5_002179 [Mactra antiquata]
MQFSKDLKSMILAAMLALLMVNVSHQKPLDISPLSVQHEQCIFECMMCVELWGSLYDGLACAQRCKLSDGASIDRTCIMGSNNG